MFAHFIPFSPWRCGSAPSLNFPASVWWMRRLSSRHRLQIILHYYIYHRCLMRLLVSYFKSMLTHGRLEASLCEPTNRSAATAATHTKLNKFKSPIVMLMVVFAQLFSVESNVKSWPAISSGFRSKYILLLVVFGDETVEMQFVFLVEWDEQMGDILVDRVELITLFDCVLIVYQSSIISNFIWNVLCKPTDVTIFYWVLKEKTFFFTLFFF